LAKGIRVNQLAKELGVESKAILAKCRDEGLGEKVPNHMSVLSLGLAETVREWFSGGSGGEGGGTAVETAAHVDVAVKPKRPRVKTRKEIEGSEEPNPSDDSEPSDQESAEAHTVVGEAPQPAGVEMPDIAPVPTPSAHAPSPAFVPAAPGPMIETRVPIVPTPVVPEPIITHAPPAAPAAPVHTAPPAPPAISTPALAPAATMPAGPSTTVPGKSAGDQGRPPVARPTITLSNRPGTGPAIVERKAIAPPVKMVVPEPAKIQGPRVVREEKPDNLPDAASPSANWWAE